MGEWGKNSFCKYVEIRSFLLFANISRSKQNQKNPALSFVDIDKHERDPYDSCDI